MNGLRVAAVDLGATSGRIMAGTVSAHALHLEEMHRFPNGGVRVRDSLFWDVLGIHREVLTGIRRVAESGPLHGIGIDSWAIDYGLLDRDGNLMGNPYSHRDSRTEGVAAKVAKVVAPQRLYATTGLQDLPFSTLYQLVAGQGTAALEAAEHLLLLPDLLAYWLTGTIGAERTNASTTGLYDISTRDWARDVLVDLGVPGSILPPMREPGDVIGPVLSDVGRHAGIPKRVPVIAVGSHDTASAVVGVPATEERFAYLSSGTWSLIGLELDAPVLTEAARAADFTNETGVDGTIRFLKNVMGLWVLSECLRAWADQRIDGTSLPALLAAAEEAPALRTVIDINDPRLLPPGDMPSRIQALAQEAGEPIPQTPVAITRCVLDSLALAYRTYLHAAIDLAGQEVDVLHIVGGGSQNHMLCQLTADACGLPVLAGPSEAAALGNVLVQARALGADLPDLAAMRALIRRTHELHRFEPTPTSRGGADWAGAQVRVAMAGTGLR